MHSHKYNNKSIETFVNTCYTTISSNDDNNVRLMDNIDFQSDVNSNESRDKSNNTQTDLNSSQKSL